MPGLAQRPGARPGSVGVPAADPDVGVGGADRGVQRDHDPRLATNVDRPLHPAMPLVAHKLQRHVRLAVAHPLGRPRPDDVGDRLDHVLQILGLGLIMGREMQLIQRVLAPRTTTNAPQHQDHEQHGDQPDADGDLQPGLDQRVQGRGGQ